MNRRATLSVMFLVLRRSRGTVKSLGLIACIAASLAVVGCGAVGNDRATSDERWERRPWREVLRDIDAFQTVSHDNVTVYHPEDLAPQAQRFAELTARQVSHVQEATGFESGFSRINVYMKRTQSIPWNRPLTILGSRDTFGFILFVRPGDESCEGIVAANTWYVSTVMHEYVEISLVSVGRKLLFDYRRKTFWGRQKEKLHFTRWFREGFAEYAGFLTYKMTVFDDSFARERFPTGVYQLGLKRHPFSSLARVGKDLFTWHQYYENPTPRELSPNLPHVGNTNLDYYGAALGLFLVIEDRYGREAIKEVMENINRLEDGDGQAVKEIVSRVLGTDIVTLVEDFRFPETGLYINAGWPGHVPNAPPDLRTDKEGLLVVLVGPDSPAQRAGIRKGDVVVSLDAQRTVTNLDFEFALYERMHQKEMELGVWREGVGTITVQLKLDE